MTESPLLQDRTVKTLNKKTSCRGSEFHQTDPISILTNVDTTDMLALAMVNTLHASTQNERGLVFTMFLISKFKYTSSILCLQFLCFWTASVCFSYWLVHWEEWIIQFLFLNIFIRGDNESYILREDRVPCYPCLLWDDVLIMDKIQKFLFSHLGKYLSWPAHCSL